ncbi:MAG: sugar-binding transcriptional regulator [Anaerolineales bacterium]|nr:sugar-binding transcriptional regulator [Anaerolineales bacterium]
MDQSVIAERIGKSRSMVSRMLQEAREMGLVEIKVNFPLKRDAELESLLAQAFNLSQAYVLANIPDDQDLLRQRLGILGARCLQNHLRDDIKIGLGSGTTVHQVVRAMPKVELKGVKVVQISGAIGSGSPVFDGSELARWLSEKLSAAYQALHAPLVVKDEALAESLLQDPTIADTLLEASQVDLALIGIGTLDPGLSSLQRVGYLNKTDLAALHQIGAIGDILSRHFNATGKPVDLPANRRVIGLDLATIHAIPTVIAVAGNAIKAPAILAALRGDFISVLVTDSLTTTEILALHGG